MTQTLRQLPLRIGLRIYQYLIHLYPQEFQFQFGDELIQLLKTEQRQRNLDEGSAFLCCLWFHWIPDLFVGALRECLTQLEGRMKNSNSISNSLALIILLAWFTFVGLSEAKYFLHLPLKELTQWILGDSFSSLALNCLNGFILLGPLAALGRAIRPIFRISRSGLSGVLLEIRVHRAAGVNLFIILSSGLATALIFGIFFLGRII